MIKAILFDFDGVICDTEPIYFEFKLDKMKRMGLDVSREWLMNYVGINFKTMIIQDYEADNKDEIIDIYFKEFDEFVVDYKQALYPDVLDFISNCRKQGIQCYICSNANKLKMESAISQLDLYEHFDDIYTSYNLKVSKPDPRFYQVILEDLNLKNDEVVVIEDSTKGIEAAKNAGIYTIAKKEYNFKMDQSYADARFDTYDELKQLLHLTFN